LRHARRRAAGSCRKANVRFAEQLAARLKESPSRFGDSYGHARKVARKLEQRCKEYQFTRSDAPVRRSIWQRLGPA
jgi:hypothetical protein